jgi:hypothetical protein
MTWKFPNQKCAAKGCNKRRSYLVIFVGACINLCSEHKADLEDNKPISWKEFKFKNVSRTISEEE